MEDTQDRSIKFTREEVINALSKKFELNLEDWDNFGMIANTDETKQGEEDYLELYMSRIN